MKPLFDMQILHTVKSTEFLPFECELCCKKFQLQAKFVRSKMKQGKGVARWCSVTCYKADRPRFKVETECGQCGKLIEVLPSELKKSKSGKSFCGSSCAARYNNAHKTTGTRRSKMEAWLELELTKQLPHLEIIFNGKETINSELDIYIPSLKLAFELNGIFHYEPIYGPEKLVSIQNNDNRKFQACLEKHISLVIIDISSVIHFKPNKAQKYFDIILKIIKEHELLV